MPNSSIQYVSKSGPPVPLWPRLFVPSAGPAYPTVADELVGVKQKRAAAECEFGGCEKD